MAPSNDAGVRPLLLGWLRGLLMRDDISIIKIREVVDNFDAHGDIESFTIVTFSGLRYTVRVERDG